jgi:hypothetical protein
LQDNEEIFGIVIGDQTFIVDRKRVHDLLTEFKQGTYKPVLVQFPSLKIGCSEGEVELHQFAEEMNLILANETGAIVKFNSNTVSLASIAGLLLSYTAIYYSKSSDSKLLDAELNVLSVSTANSPPQTLMQFSCPLGAFEAASHELTRTINEWESIISHLKLPLLEKWRMFSGEKSDVLRMQVETRRVPILSI